MTQAPIPAGGAVKAGEGLTKTQAEALAELFRYEARGVAVYWWRRASMKALISRGLVEEWRPAFLAHSTRKSLPFRLTEAGRAAARALPLTSPEDR